MGKSGSQGFSAVLDRALEALRAGQAIVYPTETVYGLGVRVRDPRALARLVALKVRAKGKPISVLVADRTMLGEVTRAIPPLAERLIERFWPGPLTLALPASEGVSEILTGGSGTIGVRIPSHPVAHELVARLGEPLTTPSANPAGERPPTTVAAARAYFGNEVAFYLDWGPTSGEPVSTVLRVSDEGVALVRAGAISVEDIEAEIGERVRR
ncbi:MAG: hypothetical protein KatS3mg077_0968 [Candidatus Binatia bacterium]|nr:MAG: hypothetical protein KatS3mg077_0968 [Candidatus Binatia bacterium]